MAYEDLNTKYNAENVEKEENFPTTTNVETIKKALERLLHTPKGHDPFNREYGSSLYNLLFKSNLSLSDVQMFLYMDITNWEPRLNIVPSDIKIKRISTNEYQVDCNFTINDLYTGVSTTIAKE